MTASYPVGDACADVVAYSATLRARTASWETAHQAVSRAHKPSNAAGAGCAVGPSWSRHRPMASCTSVSSGLPPIDHDARAVSRVNYLDSICVKHPQIRYGPGPLRRYGMFRIPTVCT
jgi:hypothetical protein